jgi:Protein of unknown function (DUF2380)
MAARQTEEPPITRWSNARSVSVAAILLLPIYAASSTSAGADAAAPPPAVRLAIFDFELEDGSAAALATEAADTSRLAEVTAEVRDLFARSGRYIPVDVRGADAPAARTHTLRVCDGCDAAIALKLGAEQSFVGVINRITRTEYVVRYQIRDARTGAVVSAASSGLRMGADYSWARGAVRLIKDQLLEVAERR